MTALLQSPVCAKLDVLVHHFLTAIASTTYRLYSHWHGYTMDVNEKHIPISLASSQFKHSVGSVIICPVYQAPLQYAVQVERAPV